MTEERNEKKEIGELEKIIEQKQFDQALTRALELVKLYPDSFQIKIQLSEIHTALDNFKDAEICLNELVMIYPENLNVLLKLAAVKQKLGKLSEAIDYYKKVLFLDPYNVAAKQKIEQVEGKKQKDGAAESPEEAPDFSYTDPVEGESIREDAADPPEIPEEEPSADTQEMAEDFQKEPAARPEDILEEIEDDELDLGSLPVEVDSPEEEETKIPADDEEFDTRDDEEPDVQILAPDVNEVSIDDDGINTGDEDDYEDIPEVARSGENVASISKIDSVLDDIAKSSEEEEPVAYEPEITPGVLKQTPLDSPAAGEEEQFYTESAARLYQEQQLFDEAIFVYENLLQSDPENEAFKKKIIELREQKKQHTAIDRLRKFKELLGKGEDRA